MKISGIVLIAAFFFYSCKPAVEEHNMEMWTQDEFIEAMVKIQLTEAYVKLGFYINKDSIIHPDSIYAKTFREIGTNKEEFEKNFEYYAQQPDKMEQIYDEVIVRLSEMEAREKGKKEDNVMIAN